MTGGDAMTSYIVEFDEAIHSDPGFRAKDYERAGVTWGAFVDDTTRVATVKRDRDRQRVETMFKNDPSVLSWKVNRSDNPPMSIYRAVILPNYHAHTVDLSLDDGDRRQVVDDIHAGRDASIFGALDKPYTFRFPALDEEVDGDADDLDRLVNAAEMLSTSGLSDDQQREIWVKAMDDRLKDIEENVDNLIYDAQGDDEEDDESLEVSNPRASRRERITLGRSKKSQAMAMATAVQWMTEASTPARYKAGADALAKLATSLAAVNDIYARLARRLYDEVRLGHGATAKSTLEQYIKHDGLAVRWSDPPQIQALNPRQQRAASRMARAGC